jgi:hypothetical protein
MLRESLQRARPTCRLPAAANRKLDRQRSDDAEGEALGHEADAREHGVPARTGLRLRAQL